ncbi:hypothetical protein JCGZ_10648 [Jatropha curcas]|uniref:Uncharacterized protein n=1 Tax=Jatropha curcas TaxID=180498 RepID=A0A067KVF7_JATCU|nr:hypothetical protein JCGZ_10648 [Jatropha curcas]
MRKARDKMQLLELVRAIARINERLRDVREVVQNGRLRFATEEVKELKKALRTKDEKEKDPFI